MKKRRMFKPVRLLILLVFAVAVYFTAGTVERIQLLLSEASIPQSIADVVVKAETVNEEFTKYDFLVRSGLGDEIVEASVISIRAEIPQGFDVVDDEGEPTESFFVEGSLADSDEWEFPVKRIVKGDDGSIFEFVAVNLTKEGFSSGEYVKLASIYIKDTGITSTFNFRVDKNYSAVFSKVRPVTNIWKTPDVLPVIASSR